MTAQLTRNAPEAVEFDPFTASEQEYADYVACNPWPPEETAEWLVYAEKCEAEIAATLDRDEYTPKAD